MQRQWRLCLPVALTRAENHAPKVWLEGVRVRHKMATTSVASTCPRGSRVVNSFDTSTLARRLSGHRHFESPPTATLHSGKTAATGSYD
jgi:hypothetical protein